MLRERNHAADAVLGLHQLETAIYIVQRQPVRDERVDVDLAGEPAVDEPRDVGSPLDAAERGSGDTPACDEHSRDDVERLALAGDAAQRREAPRLSRGL